MEGDRSVQTGLGWGSGRDAEGVGALTESFDALLRQARAAAALTQEQLAERAQLTDRGVRYLEHGLRRPNVDTVQRLARALGLSEAEQAAFLAAARPRRREVTRRPGELRLPPHPLVGREHQVGRVREQLSDREVRLLTLTGPGGVGKTSLALVAASDLRTVFPGGVVWVPLASLPDPALLSSTVAQALGLLHTATSPTPAMLRAVLDERPTLLLLDNLEHLAAAGLVGDLVATCPSLTVLVTSRSPLGIQAERDFPVPPLPTPPDELGLPIHAVAANPAVDLFLRRAQAVKATFALTDTNVAAVAAVCRRLDGLPLAIELAAARIRVLSPQALLERLDDRLGFLTGGGEDLPQRQRTMRETVAWSYDLLHTAHRDTFAQLAVFDGSFGFSALEAVLSGNPGTVLDAVEALHRSSLLLLLADSIDDEPRLQMLGTIHDFALECLACRDDENDLRDRHAAHYLKLAEEASHGAFGPDAARLLDRIEQDHANLRSALRRLLDRRDAAAGLRLCAALWPYWYVRGHATEGRVQLRAFLALPDPGDGHVVRARAEALVGAGQLAQTQGDYPAARLFLTESVALYRSVDDQRSTAAALLAAGFTARVQEDYHSARGLLEQSLMLARMTGHTFVVAAALHHLGMIAADADGDLVVAERLLEESLALYTSLGLPRFVGLLHLSLGDVACARQDYGQAHQLLTAGLTGMRQAGEKLGVHGALDSLARLAAGKRNWPRALILAAAADRLRNVTGSRAWPVVERHRSQWIACAHNHLDEGEFASAWTRGETLTLEEAIRYALNEEEPVQSGAARQDS
jgi:predicted ATPase/DNA-binding XRE family transcriptional regulator